MTSPQAQTIPAITLLEARCNSCMLCVRECVSRVWRERDGRPVPDKPQYCNRCGHCVAVCPRGAIRHPSLDPAQIRRVDRRRLNAEAFRETVQTRRSIRQFKDRPVPRPVVEDLIDLARYSPTASNRQNVAYRVVADRELLARVSREVFAVGRWIYEQSRTPTGGFLFGLLRKNAGFAGVYDRYIAPMAEYIPLADAGRDFILHGAPVLILIHTPKRASFAAENGNIAAANLMNYAHAQGLGTCYIGFLTLSLKFRKGLRRLLEIPPDHRVHASVVLGYPAFRHSFTASRKPPAVTWAGYEEAP